MGLSYRKRGVAVGLMLVLGTGAALSPQISHLRFAHAQTTSTGSAQVQCPSLFGTVPTPITVSVGTTPAGSSAAATGASTSPASAVACNAVSSQVSSLSGATTSISLCGAASDYTAPTATAPGSVTVNGLTIAIPAGYAPPSYLSVGAVIYLVILSPGGQLVEISPGFCAVPLASAAVFGSAAERVARTFAD